MNKFWLELLKSSHKLSLHFIVSFTNRKYHKI